MKTYQFKLTLKNAVTCICISFLVLCLALSLVSYYKYYSAQEEKRQLAQEDVAREIAAVKATVSYKISCLEAAEELDVSSPEIADLAITIFHASKFFNTTEDQIGNMAYYHSKEIKKHGVDMSVKNLLEAGMAEFNHPNSPIGKPTIETFNLFGSMYQVTSRAKKS